MGYVGVSGVQRVEGKFSDGRLWTIKKCGCETWGILGETRESGNQN